MYQNEKEHIDYNYIPISLFRVAYRDVIVGAKLSVTEN